MKNKKAIKNPDQVPIKASLEAHPNKKVAENRTLEWQASLSKGKFDARNNPTVICQLRYRKALPQSRLADAIGVSVASFGAIERAKRNVVLKRAEKIAKLLDTTVSTLFRKVSENNFVAIKNI